MADDQLIALMTSRMGYLSQRESVLAQNIANADTPGYKPKDLVPFTFRDSLAQAHSPGMYITNGKHITPAGVDGVGSKTAQMHSFETLPSGNAVELEQQSMEVSRTAIDYQAVTGLYKSVTGWFRSALGNKS